MLPRLFTPRVLRLLAGIVATLICGYGSVFGTAVDPHYPIRTWLVWRVVPIWAYTILFNVGCVAFGSFLLRRLLQERALPPESDCCRA